MSVEKAVTPDLRLNVASTRDLATVTMQSYAEAGPEATLLRAVDVSVYWHTPANGSEPYVVVDVDGNAPVKITRNDTTVHPTLRRRLA